MAEDEMFDSVVRSAGDKAGVFEYYGDTGYFYLYKTKGEKYQNVTATIWVLNGTPDFAGKDIAIRWDPSEGKVGLFIHGQLWAAFDIDSGEKYGGNYQVGTQPNIPLDIIGAFESQ